MPETFIKIIPPFIKLFALIIGGLLSLVLSGDIKLDENNTPNIPLGEKHLLIISFKLTLAIGIGWICGEFVIDWLDFEHMKFYSQAIFFLFFSAFGLLIFGILYRACQLTFDGKSLSEIVTEIKNITKALIK